MADTNRGFGGQTMEKPSVGSFAPSNYNINQKPYEKVPTQYVYGKEKVPVNTREHVTIPVVGKEIKRLSEVGQLAEDTGFKFTETTEGGVDIIPPSHLKIIPREDNEVVDEIRSLVEGVNYGDNTLANTSIPLTTPETPPPTPIAEPSPAETKISKDGGIPKSLESKRGQDLTLKQAMYIDVPDFSYKKGKVYFLNEENKKELLPQDKQIGGARWWKMISLLKKYERFMNSEEKMNAFPELVRLKESMRNSIMMKNFAKAEETKIKFEDALDEAKRKSRSSTREEKVVPAASPITETASQNPQNTELQPQAPSPKEISEELSSAQRIGTYGIAFLKGKKKNGLWDTKNDQKLPEVNQIGEEAWKKLKGALRSYKKFMDTDEKVKAFPKLIKLKHELRTAIGKTNFGLAKVKMEQLEKELARATASPTTTVPTPPAEPPVATTNPSLQALFEIAGEGKTSTDQKPSIVPETPKVATPENKQKSERFWFVGNMTRIISKQLIFRQGVLYIKKDKKSQPTPIPEKEIKGAPMTITEWNSITAFLKEYSDFINSEDRAKNFENTSSILKDIQKALLKYDFDSVRELKSEMEEDLKRIIQIEKESNEFWIKKFAEGPKPLEKETYAPEFIKTIATGLRMLNGKTGEWEKIPNELLPLWQLAARALQEFRNRHETKEGMVEKKNEILRHLNKLDIQSAAISAQEYLDAKYGRDAVSINPAVEKVRARLDNFGAVIRPSQQTTPNARLLNMRKILDDAGHAYHKGGAETLGRPEIKISKEEREKILEKNQELLKKHMDMYTEDQRKYWDIYANKKFLAGDPDEIVVQKMKEIHKDDLALYLENPENTPTKKKEAQPEAMKAVEEVIAAREKNIQGNTSSRLKRWILAMVGAAVVGGTIYQGYNDPDRGALPDKGHNDEWRDREQVQEAKEVGNWRDAIESEQDRAFLTDFSNLSTSALIAKYVPSDDKQYPSAVLELQGYRVLNDRFVTNLEGVTDQKGVNHRKEISALIKKLETLAQSVLDKESLKRVLIERHDITKEIYSVPQDISIGAYIEIIKRRIVEVDSTYKE
jgi:hypothetical protein